MSETFTTYGIGIARQRGPVMARREELWTVKVGKRIAKLKRTREQIAGLAALAEHARAVRIVKRLQKNAERGGFGLAYGVALKDVLTALTKGRA